MDFFAIPTPEIYSKQVSRCFFPCFSTKITENLQQEISKNTSKKMFTKLNVINCARLFRVLRVFSFFILGFCGTVVAVPRKALAFFFKVQSER